MGTQITVDVPDDVMKRLRAMADREYRTPAMQALWLIEHSLSTRRFQPPDLQAAEVLAAALRELHARAGSPGTRKIAASIGGISHTTVATALRGHPVPSWSVTERLAAELGGDPARFRELWAAIRPGPG